MFEFLAQRADASANVVAHRSHRELNLEVRADDDSTFVTIGPAGIQVADTLANGGPDIVMSASAKAWPSAIPQSSVVWCWSI